MSGLVRLTPRTLREKLQYTDNIDGIRDKCQTAEALIDTMVVPAWKQAIVDMILFGTGTVDIDWDGKR